MHCQRDDTRPRRWPARATRSVKHRKGFVMGRLEGKVAVVTGANSGIGLATAKLHARAGARLFMTGRRQAELDDAVREVGGNARGVRGDVSALADLDRWILDLAPGRIRVNVLAPGATSTPGWHGPAASEEQNRQMQALATAATPLGRLGAPEETASAALFLASDESGFVNGSELFVDGGSAEI